MMSALMRETTTDYTNRIIVCFKYKYLMLSFATFFIP